MFSEFFNFIFIFWDLILQIISFLWNAVKYLIHEKVPIRFEVRIQSFGLFLVFIFLIQSLDLHIQNHRFIPHQTNFGIIFINLFLNKNLRIFLVNFLYLQLFIFCFQSRIFRLYGGKRLFIFFFFLFVSLVDFLQKLTNLKIIITEITL